MENIIQEKKYIEFLYNVGNAENINLYRNIVENIQNLNRKNLEIFIREKYNCYNVMEFIFNIFTVLINRFISDTLIEPLSKWITDLTKLSEGLNGITLSAGIKYISSSLVVKVAKNKNIDDNNDILHEFFVGTLLNTLRKDIPNFVYTFGLFPCDITKNFCEKKGQYYASAIEYIEGKSLEKIIKDGEITSEELLKIVLQILFALYYAENKYRFVHNDLHTENIIVRQLRTRQIVQYRFMERQVNIVSDMVPVIIDYGYSRIEYDGKAFGHKTRKDLGIQSSVYKPGIDVFHLCCSVINSIGKNSIYDDVERLLYQSIKPLLSEKGSKKIIENKQYENYCLPTIGDTIVDISAEQFIYRLLTVENLDGILNLNSPPKGFVQVIENCPDMQNIEKKIFEKPVKKACAGNDWERLSGGWKDKYGKERYWFECGEFQYDGTFNTVKFPKGMALYHGSMPLSYYNTTYPLGLDYFDSSKKMTIEEKNILKSTVYPQSVKEEIMKNATDEKITLSYFGDHKVAMDYSSTGTVNNLKCGKNCISAYRLSTDIIMVNLYDPFNMYVLLTDSKLSETARKILANAYDIKTVNDFVDLYEKIVPPTDSKSGNIDISTQPMERLQQAYDPFKRFIVKSQRGSLRGQNYLVPNELIEIFLKEGYTGFVNPRSPYLPGSGREGLYRFGELVFGKNVLSVLYRDYSNKWDWQYMDIKRLFGEIGKLVKDFMKYKTTNIDFHQGDLYQHSVWTALYTQREFSKGTFWVSGIPQDFAPLCIFAAFIHDIGKGGDMVYSFYDKPEHPEVGFEYLTGEKQYKYKTLKNGNIKILDIPALLDNVNLGSPISQKIIAFLIKVHWEFGDYIKTLKNDMSNLETVSRGYLDYLDLSREEAGIETGNPDDRLILYLMAMLISACDIMASSVYIDSDKFAILTYKLKTNPELIVNDLNSSLISFPYISNVGKVHRGQDSYKKFKIEEKGGKIREWIINNINIMEVE